VKNWRGFLIVLLLSTVRFASAVYVRGHFPYIYYFEPATQSLHRLKVPVEVVDEGIPHSKQDALCIEYEKRILLYHGPKLVSKFQRPQKSRFVGWWNENPVFADLTSLYVGNRKVLPLSDRSAALLKIFKTNSTECRLYKLAQPDQFEVVTTSGGVTKRSKISLSKPIIAIRHLIASVTDNSIENLSGVVLYGYGRAGIHLIKSYPRQSTGGVVPTNDGVAVALIKFYPAKGPRWPDDSVDPAATIVYSVKANGITKRIARVNYQLDLAAVDGRGTICAIQIKESHGGNDLVLIRRGKVIRCLAHSIGDVIPCD
jgi:hypothetical protein